MCCALSIDAYACIRTDRYLHAVGISWDGNLQGDGSILLLTEQLIFIKCSHVIVDGDLYPHPNTRCHRAISELSQSLQRQVQKLVCKYATEHSKHRAP